MQSPFKIASHICQDIVIFWNTLNEYVPVSFKTSHLTSQWEKVNFLVISIKLFAYFGPINVLKSVTFLCENMCSQWISVNPCKRLHCDLSPIKSSSDISSTKADSCPSCRCWFGPNFVWVRRVKFRVAGYFWRMQTFQNVCFSYKQQNCVPKIIIITTGNPPPMHIVQCTGQCHIVCTTSYSWKGDKEILSSARLVSTMKLNLKLFDK